MNQSIDDTVKFVYGHAEAFVGYQSVRTFLRSSFRNRVKAVVIDEAHFIVQWKDFRRAYTKLNLLGSFMPKTPILALTATATPCYQKEIKRSLGMQNVIINVEANPNLENIFYSVLPRGKRGDEKLIDVIKPFALELKEKVISSPLTTFYGNLETCGECYSYFEQELGEQQFYPPGSPANFSNRLFAQYHAQYPEEYRTSLVKS
ncbi:ATP-dependent DNA helicase RecQ-like [Montipora foliosa]|uniref:ATP-dependent DNA helicase RecQ-like n=1 Tax=Montipora foliosa TaxID=591990 RepID=UPI0035F1F0E0